MLGAVELFIGGEDLCKKIVGSDSRMEITARLRLAIGLSVENFSLLFPICLHIILPIHRPNNMCLVRWFGFNVRMNYATK